MLLMAFKSIESLLVNVPLQAHKAGAQKYNGPQEHASKIDVQGVPLRMEGVVGQYLGAVAKTGQCGRTI